jgi:hypothetical protein
MVTQFNAPIIHINHRTHHTDFSPLPSSAPPQGVRRLYSLRIAADLSSPLRPSAVTKTPFQPARGDHARKESRREEYDQPVGAVPLEHEG